MRDVLDWGRRTLDDAGIPGSHPDARILLSHVTGVAGLQLRFVEREPTGFEIQAYGALIEARARERVPVQYLTGQTEFLGLPLRVVPGVFIPRPETEHLVEAALAHISCLELPRAADLGTGSGAIAVSLAVRHAGLTVWATDISTIALDCARVNANRHGVADRIAFAAGDLLDPLFPVVPRSLDLIACNPPYVRTGDIADLEPEVRVHEPAMALDGGRDGLDLYRRVLAGARKLCRTDAVIALELGAGQLGEVVCMARDGGYGVIEVIPDYAGHERVLMLRV